ncbi:MAG: SDR family oxidoreductase [Alphaproteobacteria bacterium]|nr:SDR family oxidoreductase [Alphaproteobacteria bacterium]
MNTSPKTTTKVAIITGAARRIGRAIALQMAAEGWAIAIHHNTSSEEANALVDQIEGSGGRAAAVACDLSSIEALDELIPQCSELLGAPTCLVNNASAFLDDSPEIVCRDVWDTHMDTNLRAPVFLSKSFAAQLPDGANGNIINIIDQRVLRPTPEFFSYTLSKAALWTATKTLAQALAPSIRVNAVGPGPVLKSIHQSDQDFADEVSGTLLARACSPEEIASAVSFILATPAITGQMITLDSGQHLA